jgi:hypothetical protein
MFEKESGHSDKRYPKRVSTADGSRAGDTGRRLAAERVRSTEGAHAHRLAAADAHPAITYHITTADTHPTVCHRNCEPNQCSYCNSHRDQRTQRDCDRYECAHRNPFRGLSGPGRGEGRRT